MGALVDLMREDRERRRQLDAEAKALARRVHEYTPEPPHERRVYDDLSREGQDMVEKLARQMVEGQQAESPKRRREYRTASGGRIKLYRPGDYQRRRALMIASRQAAETEGMHALLREGFELLAQRDKRDRLVVRVSLAFGGIGSLAAVASLFLR